MVSSELRSKRVSAGISGAVLCLKAGIGRTRLSGIERQTIAATPEEVERIIVALEQLVLVKRKQDEIAASMGWPMAIAK